MAQEWTPPTEPINSDWKPPTEPVSAQPQTEQPSVVDRFLRSVSGMLSDKTSTTGPNGEQIPILGPRLQKIPGLEAAGEYIKNKGINTGNYWGGFAGSILGDLVGGAATATDPRTVFPAHAPAPLEIKPVVNPAVAEQVIKKEPLALPPAPLSATHPPRFFGGEQGMADALAPNKIDLGPNPEHLSGTVLPQEFGTTHTVPPDIAAQYTGEGKPTTQIPVDTSRLLPGEVGPETGWTQPKYYTGEGTARPGEPQLDSAPIKLSRMLDQHPGFANGDIPKPPIEVLQDKIPPTTAAEQVIPPPGKAKVFRDVNNARAEFGSVDQTLSSRPETKPIADIIVGAQDQKLKWVAQIERELADISKGLRKAARITLGRLIDGQEIAGANPLLIQKAQQARQIMDRVFEMIPEGSRWERGNVGYIENYLTHIERQPEDIQSAMKDIWDYHLGEKNPIYRLFKRDVLTSSPEVGEESLGDVIYQKGKGDPKSPFTQTRTGQQHQYELDVNKVFPAYIESIAKVIYDRPAVDEAKKLVAALPEGSKLKELAGWYIKNYTKYDALPGLTEAWNNWASTVSRITSRSLLSFNPGLQTLHVARLVGNMWPELGSKYSAIGLKEVATHPVNAWFEAAKNGLLYNEVRPLAFKTPMQRFDSVANFFSMADYLDKAIGYHGYKRMFLDQGMSESQAAAKALNETKRVSMTADPARITKTFAADSPVLGGAIGTLAKQYKQVPVKIIEQYATIVANIKNNPQAAARLTAGVAALLAANEVGGLHTFHLGSNVVPKDLWGAFGSAVSKVTSSLVKGDWQQAVVDTTLWATPGGQSLNRQITQGQPSIFENQKQPVKLKFINP